MRRELKNMSVLHQQVSEWQRWQKKARDARTVKTVRTKLVGKAKASVASRLTKAVASRGFGNQKPYPIKYMLSTTNEGAVDDVPNKKIKPAFKVDGSHTSHCSQEKTPNTQT